MGATKKGNKKISKGGGVRLFFGKTINQVRRCRYEIMCKDKFIFPDIQRLGRGGGYINFELYSQSLHSGDIYIYIVEKMTDLFTI